MVCEHTVKTKSSLVQPFAVADPTSTPGVGSSGLAGGRPRPTVEDLSGSIGGSRSGGRGGIRFRPKKGWVIPKGPEIPVTWLDRRGWPLASEVPLTRLATESQPLLDEVPTPGFVLRALLEFAVSDFLSGSRWERGDSS